MLPQSSCPAQLLNNKLSSNSVSDGRVEPEDTESLFLHFGLPPSSSEKPLEMVTVISPKHRSGCSLGCALSLRPLLLLCGIQGILLRKVNTLSHTDTLLHTNTCSCTLRHTHTNTHTLTHTAALKELHGNPWGVVFGNIMCLGKAQDFWVLWGSCTTQPCLRGIM